MTKFVPYSKMSKKNQRIYDNEEREFFGRSSCTIPHKSLKDYNRKNNKNLIYEEMYYNDEIEDDDYEY